MIYILVCDDGEYTSDRMCVPCPGHCNNGESCNKLTGRCDNGCQNYWTGDFCEGVYTKSSTGPFISEVRLFNQN